MDRTAPDGGITGKAVAERRLVVLRDLAARASEATTAEDACAIAAETLAAHAADVPFALLYLIDASGTFARLAGAAGVNAGEAISLRRINLRGAVDEPWPFSDALRRPSAGLEIDLTERFDALPPGPWLHPPQAAVILPISSHAPNEPVGLLVAGVSAGLTYDEHYRDFFDLVRAQIATAIANARAHQALQAEADELARLHEFSVRLATPIELSQVLDETLTTAAGILASDLALLMLHDRGRDELQTAASLGSQAEFLELVGRAPPINGAIGTALAKRRRVVIEDFEDDPGTVAFHEAAQAAGVRAVYCAPLVTAGGESVGAVACYFHEPHRPSERQMRLVELYARLAAEQIGYARLFRQTEDALRSRDAFLTSAAHDLKTPMTAIKGTAQILRRRANREGVRNTERLLQGLADIDTVVTKMAAQIDELRDLARLEMGELLLLRRRATDLVALIRRSVKEQQKTSARHHIRVEATTPELIGNWDAARLARVLHHVIGNAIKYSPRGGEITLTVHQADYDARAWAVVVVHDQGLGIPSGDLPHIFKRFHRGANVGGTTFGSGIGLVSAKRIVEQHGGTITVESQPEIGSTFVVRLPLSMPGDKPVNDHIEH